jgi:transposase InsO family protein
MKNIMNIEQISSIAEVEAFLTGTQPVIFSVASSKDERYAWIEKTLQKFRYRQLGKADRGVVIQFLCKVSQYSRQQITRLISQYMKKGKIVRRQITANGFKKRYTDKDINLLARVDELHETANGAAIKKICERAYKTFSEEAYERLSEISVSHIYNLRQSKTYLKQRRVFEKTKSKSSSIGVRRKPEPNNTPGYIRVDTVHQGDLDGKKGVYHINAVDEVTQFEVVVSVEKISEAYLVPALKMLLATFPFKIINFHSDNGSEYVNQYVAKLLKKLLIEFTKSRPRHSNDNALAECKNAVVVRKRFGYSHIPQQHAERINEFNRKFLNPYVNYHRPCFFPTIITDKKGKQKKEYRYENMMTPFEKLKSLPGAKRYLKKGLTFSELTEQANQLSDNEAAEQLLEARKALFKEIGEQDKQVA